MTSREQTLVDQIIGDTCKTAACFAEVGKAPAEGNLLPDLQSDNLTLRAVAMAAERFVWAYAEHAARTERVAERSARIMAENTRHLVEAPLAVSANAVGSDTTSWLYEAGLTEGLRAGAVEALKLWADLKAVVAKAAAAESGTHSCGNCSGEAVEDVWQAQMKTKRET